MPFIIAFAFARCTVVTFLVHENNEYGTFDLTKGYNVLWF